MSMDAAVKRVKLDALELHTRETELVNKFITFRDELIQALDGFAEEVLKTGIHGVSRCKTALESDGMQETRLTLNGLALAIVSSDKVRFVPESGGTLACKILIFVEPSEEDTPFLDITCREPTRDRLRCCDVTRSSSEGMKPLGGYHLTDEGATSAAAKIVELFYQLRPNWRPEPQYEPLLRGVVTKRPIGFLE